MSSKNSILIDLSDAEWAQFDLDDAHDFILKPKPQKVFIAVFELEREVNNGGFSQYFLNSSAVTAHFVVEALETISAPKTADICKRAIATAFPEGLPADLLGFRDVSSDFPMDIEETLGELDGEFFDYPHDLTALLYDYVKQHPQECGAVEDATE